MTELTQLPGEPPPQHSPAAGAVLLGPPTQAHLSAWGETAGPPTLNTPATLRVPHTAGAGACASSRAISTSGGWGGRGCVSGIPSTHPPHTPHHTPAPPPPASGQQQLAFLLPSLSWVSYLSPNAPAQGVVLCPPASGATPLRGPQAPVLLPACQPLGDQDPTLPHTTPHHPSQPPRFQPCPHQCGQGHYQGHQPTAPGAAGPSASPVCPATRPPSVHPACGTRS